MFIFERQEANTMAKDRFDIKEKEGVSFMTDAIVIVDKETGVNYLFVCRGYGGGLTPLLDANGKPIITKDGYRK
jgi:hypothetical protein